MKNKESSLMWRRLRGAGRISLALAGGAAFAYLAWNPQPPPPQPGMERASKPKPATGKIPKIEGTQEIPDRIERVGLIGSRTTQFATRNDSANHQHASDLKNRDAIEYSIRRRAQYETHMGYGNVTALSRGPPASDRTGKEAPCPLSSPIDRIPS